MFLRLNTIMVTMASSLLRSIVVTALKKKDVGAQHQNACAEWAIQTIMYMARTSMVHSLLHWTDCGSDDLSLWSFCGETFGVDL